MNILDMIFGNCEKGVHKYKSFVLKETPPNNIASLKTGYTSDAIDMIHSLTKVEYEIRCKNCGKKVED